jgi:hypothetical protein
MLYKMPETKQIHETFVDKHERKDYLFPIILNLIFLFIIIKIVKWNLAILTPDIYLARSIMIPVQIVHTIVNIFEFIYIKKLGLRHILKIVGYFFGLTILIILFFIFPFDFSVLDSAFWITLLVRGLLGIGLATVAGVVFVNLIRLPKFLQSLKNPPEEEE